MVTAGDGASVNILAIFSAHTPYNTCRNFEWQSTTLYSRTHQLLCARFSESSIGKPIGKLSLRERRKRSDLTAIHHSVTAAAVYHCCDSNDAAVFLHCSPTERGVRHALRTDTNAPCSDWEGCVWLRFLAHTDLFDRLNLKRATGCALPGVQQCSPDVHPRSGRALRLRPRLGRIQRAEGDADEGAIGLNLKGSRLQGWDHIDVLLLGGKTSHLHNSTSIGELAGGSSTAHSS
eukprot:5065389-Prymnesium_polylepis.1